MAPPLYFKGAKIAPFGKDDFMKTINDLKQEFVEHLATLDKSTMSLYELSSYADLLRKTDDLFKPGFAESLGVMPPFGALFGGKEGKNHG